MGLRRQRAEVAIVQRPKQVDEICFAIVIERRVNVKVGALYHMQIE